MVTAHNETTGESFQLDLEASERHPLSGNQELLLLQAAGEQWFILTWHGPKHSIAGVRPVEPADVLQFCCAFRYPVPDSLQLPPASKPRLAALFRDNKWRGNSFAPSIAVIRSAIGEQEQPATAESAALKDLPAADKPGAYWSKEKTEEANGIQNPDHLRGRRNRGYVSADRRSGIDADKRKWIRPDRSYLFLAETAVPPAK